MERYNRGHHNGGGLGGAPSVPDLSLFQRVERHVWRRIFAGFLVLIPLLATIFILSAVYRWLDERFEPIVTIESISFLDVPGIGVAFTLVALYVVGVIVAARAGQKAFDWQNAVLSRIPVVKSIYGVAKQATDALVSPTGHRFSRVVFVEWPRPGVKALGFVTGHCHSPDAGGSLLLVVYIPTVPNPTSGNLAFVGEEDIVETDLSIEDAMKLVFSGGFVLPEGMKVNPEFGGRELPGP